MNYKQVKPQKGYEMVIDQIMEHIVSGKLLPGARLASVVDLGASFGVGRSTVREALSALKAMGWLDIRQGGGTYVSAELPREDNLGFTGLLGKAESLKELLEVRKVLETGCAALAAKHRNEADLDKLQYILNTMQVHLDHEEEGEQADVQFHLLIAEASHNTLLLNMMQSLSQHMQEMMKDSRKLWFYGEHATAQRLLQEHTNIYTAIQQQNETLASETMLLHILKVENVVVKMGS